MAEDKKQERFIQQYGHIELTRVPSENMEKIKEINERNTKIQEEKDKRSE